jgi:hypothetical protein
MCHRAKQARSRASARVRESERARERARSERASARRRASERKRERGRRERGRSERERRGAREGEREGEGERGRERESARAREEAFFRKGLGLDNILEEAEDNHQRKEVLELERVVDDLCSRAHHLESAMSIRRLLPPHTKQIKIEESICAGAFRNLRCVRVSAAATKSQLKIMWERVYLCVWMFARAHDRHTLIHVIGLF